MRLEQLIKKAQAALAEHGNVTVLADEGFTASFDIETVEGNSQALDWGFSEGDTFVMISANR